MAQPRRILVVDDEESIRFTFAAFLSDAGYGVDMAESLTEAATLVGENDYDVIFLDILLGRESGMQLLRIMHEQNPNCQVVMVTGSPEIATAAESVRLGAFDYLVKPVQKEELLRTARLALDRKEMVDRHETFRRRMAAVFDSIQEGVLIFDEGSRLVDMNASAQQLLQCEHGLEGRTLGEIVETCSCPMIAGIREVVAERCMGEIYRCSVANCANRTVVISMTMAPLTSHSGRETGVVLVMRDEGLPSHEISAGTN